MKISIVLSTYNGSQYIEEQLDSLRNQTYTADEVLISDDCSQDNTVQIIETYIKKYELLNWELEVNEKNCGWRKNFMNLITSAMGDIVFTCDQDDIWSADKIQKMTQIMEENPEVLLLVSQYTEFYENGYTKIMPKRKTKGYIEKQMLVHNFTAIPYPGCTYAIRKSLAREARQYWEPDFPHDSLLWRLAMFCEGLYIINEPLIRMRKHYDSTFTKESRDSKKKKIKRDQLDYEKRIFDGMTDFLHSHNDIVEREKKEQLLENCYKWNLIRKEFYDNKNPFMGIRLIKYINYYPNIKRFLADWFWTYKEK